MVDTTKVEMTAWVDCVVRQFEGRLVRYALHVTRELESAQDAVQETFLRLCREDRESIEDHVAQWLFTVCRRVALDIRRKQKRVHQMSHEQTAVQQSREDSQVALAEQKESLQRIQQLVEGLSDNQQEVVRLKFQEGLSYREISRITELSVTNVGYLIHTAISKIRQQLGPELA